MHRFNELALDRAAVGFPRWLAGRCGVRDVVNSIFYIAQSGCQWRLLPKDFPPYTTVQQRFYAWRDNGTWQTINHVLLTDVREAAGREDRA